MRVVRQNGLSVLFWNSHEARLRAGWRIALQALFVSLPLLIIGSTGFSAASNRPESRAVMVAVPLTLLVILAMARWIDRRQISDLGLQIGDRRWWADYGVGLVAGLMASIAMVAVLVALGWAEVVPGSLLQGAPATVAATVLISLATYAGVGLFEESIRVYQVRNLMEGLSKSRMGRLGAVMMALLIPALYSLVMHTGNDLGMVFRVYVLLNGMLYVLYYLWTGRAALVRGQSASA
jgi:membrane protease YdiL (CAAX protease family)